MRIACLIPIVLVFSPGPGQAQDVAAGEKEFAQYRTCHQVGETAKNAA
jgi:cytochrome c